MTEAATTQAALTGDGSGTDRIHTLAVHPGSALATHDRLFDALTRVFPLRVVPFDPADLTPFDGVVSLGRADDGGSPQAAVERAGLPLYLVADPAPGAPSGAAGAATSGAAERGVVTFTGAGALNPYLRGRRIEDDRVGTAAALDGGALDEVLASVDGRAIWGRRNGGATHVVSVAPPDLAGTAALGEHLTTGSFAALLPLVQYLRDLTRGEDWTPPPLRASITLDDPNLASQSYGWLDYNDLVTRARAHNFHVSIATVPLDAWLAPRSPSPTHSTTRPGASCGIWATDTLSDRSRSPSLAHLPA